MSKNKIGICNICLKKSKLTWEHVPPKSCENFDKVIINDQFPQPQVKKLNSQNGIKYRTICEKCNNEMGGNSDKELKKLFDDVKGFITKEKNINAVRVITINLKLVLKSVFGKFLAMDYEPAKDLISKSMRDFITWDIKPQNFAVYFRLYPYDLSVQARTILCSDYFPEIIQNDYNNPYLISGVISVLNFFPLSFTIASGDKEDKNMFVNLIDYLDLTHPIVNLTYGYSTSFNPITKRPLPYDWLIGVADDKHPFVLTSKNSPIRISWKETKSKNGKNG